VELAPGDPFRNEPLVLVGQRGCGVAHRAVSYDVEDVLRRHLLQHRRFRSLMAWVVALMTRGAVAEVLSDARAFRLRGGVPRKRGGRYEQDRNQYASHHCPAYLVV